jgi:menaquinone-dependent protoporphyrinogen oxidase
MPKILVTYTSMAGSTAEVAQTIAAELTHSHLQVDLRPLAELNNLAGYDAVVLGAPMIMGWHRHALRFLKQHRPTLQHIPLALFVTAMSLTKTGETLDDGLPIYVDEHLPKASVQPGRLTFRERYARLPNYLRPILAAAHPAKPVTIGVFGGRLEYGRLPWWAVLFAMFIIQAPAGDRRNWPAIRAWAATLPTLFHLNPTPAEQHLAHQPAFP